MRGRLRPALLAACLIAAVLPAKSAALSLDPVGTFADPIYVTSPPGDPRLFVVERAGRIKVVKNGVTLGTNFLDITPRTTVDGERGLLSMAFDPNFATNGLFYVDSTADGTNAGPTVGDIHIDEYRVSANPDVADPLTRRDVLVINRPNVLASNHNGGQLQFGPDGLLYISVGDGGTGGDPAQDGDSLNGKLLRIDPHLSGANPYSVPASNPFAGTSGADEIWSLGLRNPFRFSFDHRDGALTIGDVGETSYEEIDYRPRALGGGRGENFGWPCREGFSTRACTGLGPGTLTAPTFDYPHADPGGGAAFGCSIIGGYVYRGSDIPALAGRYVYADLCGGVLRSQLPGLPVAGGDRSEGVAIPNGPHAFGEDARCELYVVAGDQTVSKIVAAPGAQPGSGGCDRGPGKAPPHLPAAISLSLKAKKRQVRKGKRVSLEVSAEPCIAAGEPVSVLRAVKVVRTEMLGADCKATFHLRIRRRSRFSALIAGTTHVAAASSQLTIKIKH